MFIVWESVQSVLVTIYEWLILDVRQVLKHSALLYVMRYVFAIFVTRIMSLPICNYLLKNEPNNWNISLVTLCDQDNSSKKVGQKWTFKSKVSLVHSNCRNLYFPFLQTLWLFVSVSLKKCQFWFLKQKETYDILIEKDTRFEILKTPIWIWLWVFVLRRCFCLIYCVVWCYRKITFEVARSIVYGNTWELFVSLSHI